MFELVYSMRCHNCGDILWARIPWILLAMMDDHLEEEFKRNTRKTSVV